MREKQNTNDRTTDTTNTCKHIDTHMLGTLGHVLQELELVVFEFQKRNMVGALARGLHLKEA